MHLSLKKHLRWRQESRTRFGTRLGKVVAKISSIVRAKSLSSADGTSRAWSAIGRSVTLPLADWWIQTDQLINDALEVVLQEDEIVGESGSNPLAPLQSKIINLGQQLTRHCFKVPSNRVGSKLKKLPKQNKKLQLRWDWMNLFWRVWEILHTGNYFQLLNHL